jgi:ribosomal protein S18 acetylase RimI-like enzyme
LTHSHTTIDGPRLLRSEELRAANRLSNLCFGDIDPGPEEEDLRYTPPRRGGLYVLAQGDKLVSQIGVYHAQISVYECLFRVASIGGVCTHPDYRGKGLANQLMEYCTAKLVEEGARLMLISGARGLYTRLGNVPHGRFRYFNLQPGQDASTQTTPADSLLRRMRPADLPAVIQMYQAEPLHYLRSYGEFAEALQNPTGNPYIHAEQWIVERSGQAAAYLFVGSPWGARLEDGIRQLSEYAGSRQAIAEALGALATTGTFQHLYWPVAWQDSELIRLIEACGYPGTWLPLHGHTWRIVNFPGLMRDLRPLLRARLSADLRRGLRFEQSGPLLGGSGTDRYAIVRGQEHLELDGAAMTRLVFGMAQVETEPLKIPGALAEVTAALFPLPSFLPGLNYR